MFSMFDPAEYERQKMAASQNLHDAYGFIGSLDADGLHALDLILSCITNAGAENKAIQFASCFLGVVEAMQQEKYGKCLACGKNHDEELARAVEQ